MSEQGKGHFAENIRDDSQGKRHPLEAEGSGNEEWRWNSTLHTSPVLHLGRSPLAPQGRMRNKFIQTKSLSFSIDTNQLSNLARLGKERVQNS